MTDPLIAFLRARLDEDERTALAATQGDWVWSREFVTPPGYHHRDIGPLEPGDAAHIARFAPARVLAGIEAKQEVVRLAERANDYHETFVNGFGAAMEQALRLYAAAYADHPDYRPEWAR